MIAKPLCKNEAFKDASFPHIYVYHCLYAIANSFSLFTLLGRKHTAFLMNQKLKLKLKLYFKTTQNFENFACDREV